MPSRSIIKFEQVTKKFGEITALEDVSFKIKKGEIVFVTGCSGAGKTTLIKLLIRQLEPTAGKILIDGQDLQDLKRKELISLRRRIGVAFQDFKLLPDRTLRENVSLVLEVLKEDKEIEKKVDEVLDWVGLLDRADLFPSQLAGGELQRASLARAAVAEPDIFVADEPTGNLDVTTSWQIINFLQGFNRKGKTVIVATHDFEIVNSMQTRVIELEKGKIVRDEEKGKYKVK